MSHQVPFRAYPTWVLISQFLCVKDWHFGVLALFATKERGTARTTFCWMWLNVHNWYFNIFHDYIQWCWIISEIKSKYLDIVLMTYECACIYIYMCVCIVVFGDWYIRDYHIPPGFCRFHRDQPVPSRSHRGVLFDLWVIRPQTQRNWLKGIIWMVVWNIFCFPWYMG